MGVVKTGRARGLHSASCFLNPLKGLGPLSRGLPSQRAEQGRDGKGQSHLLCRLPSDQGKAALAPVWGGET